MKMRTKDINTLAQLREEKSNLKLRIKLADEEVKDNIIYSTINKLFSSKKDKNVSYSDVLDHGTQDAIRFLANQHSGKFMSGKVPQLILSLAVTIAAPIIVSKFRNWIK